AGNDIDLAMPFSVYMHLSGMNKLDAFTVTSRDDPEYDRSDIACLVQTMRGGRDGQINILCISDEYILSYYAAVAEQRRSPDKYSSREDRVNLYRKYELMTKDMLDGKVPSIRFGNRE